MKATALGHGAPWTVVLALLFSLAGCQRSPEQLWARAEAAADSGDYAAASIDLKSLLQRQPANAEARAALAQASLELGDAVSAEKEIRRALSLQPDADTDARRLLLGKALLGQEKFAEVHATLAEVSARTPEEQLDARMLSARAYEGLGDDAEAERLFRAAMAAAPAEPAPKVRLINLLFRGRRDEEGDRLIADALVSNPQNISLLVLQGRRIVDTRGPAVAEPHFRRLLDLADEAEEKAEVLIGLAELQLQRGALADADASIGQLENLTPGGLLAFYMRSRFLAQSGDYAAAIASLQQILKVDSEFEPAERLLGTVQYLNGNFEQAAMHIQRVVARRPDAFLVRMLADLRLRQNRPERAMQTLLPMIRESPGAVFDEGLLILAGQASLSLGNTDEAGEFFRRGAEQFPADERFRLGEISARLASGDVATARLMLEGLRASTSNRLAIDYLAVVADLADRRFEAAFSLARRLATENPGVAWSHLLLATVNLYRNDIADARREFERVLAIEPTNKEALINLALLDFQSGDQNGGEARLQRVIEADPADFRPRLLIGEAHLAARRYNQALDQARAAIQLSPDTPAALNFLARSAAANGRWDIARDSFNRITVLDPRNARAWLNLARATVANGRAKQMPTSMTNAMSLAPDDPVVLQTAGDLYMELGQVGVALDSYRKAYAIEATGDLSVRLCQARNVEKPGSACSELLQWVRLNPRDIGPHLFKATLHQARGESREAIADYESVIGADRRQVQAINNLAWLYFQAGDGRAEGMAERALELQPDSASVMDTLGWIRLRSGDVQSGVKLVASAAKRAPADPELQYHLAYGLAKTGQLADARRTLQILLARSEAFPSRADAESLQRQLEAGGG
ncbi:MAG: tetratricopeptide repeat protein [Gammaproteobacteria bacterium]|nr:tetratricopeptide repeat protein [Gammaproteobacteria bacterium]